MQRITIENPGQVIALVLIDPKSLLPNLQHDLKDIYAILPDGVYLVKFDADLGVDPIHQLRNILAYRLNSVLQLFEYGDVVYCQNVMDGVHHLTISRGGVVSTYQLVENQPVCLLVPEYLQMHQTPYQVRGTYVNPHEQVMRATRLEPV